MVVLYSVRIVLKTTSYASLWGDSREKVWRGGGKQKSVEQIIMVLMEGLHTERGERERLWEPERLEKWENWSVQLKNMLKAFLTPAWVHRPPSAWRAEGKFRNICHIPNLQTFQHCSFNIFTASIKAFLESRILVGDIMNFTVHKI